MPLLFSIMNSCVLPVWALMIFAPRGRVTARILSSPLIVLVPIAVYAVLVLPAWREVLPVVVQPELGPVAQLLGSANGATIAWAHFLAFDLWVGRFIVLDARTRALPTAVLSGILVLTLLLGPLGLAAYGLACAKPVQRARTFLKLSFEGNTALTWLGIGSSSVGLVCFALQAIDPRQLAGASVWLKPTKFGLSIGLLGFTLALLLRVLRMPEKLRRRAVFAVVFFTGLELVIIGLQAARGVASHFNAATALDGALFTLMGAGIVIVTLAIATLAWYALRTPYENRALGSGIRSGLAIMLLGSCVAFFMTRPTQTQLASMQAGQPTPVVGAHAVGAPDDAPGLPLTRWNMQGGDLRVPHFIGMHALQLLPLAGLWLGRRRALRPQLALRLTRIAAAGYLGIVLTSLVQALRGQPLLAADALTFGMLAALALACALAALAAWLADHAQRAKPLHAATLIASHGG